MNRTIFPMVLAFFAGANPLPAQAQNGVGAAGDIVRVDLLKGWRKPDGRHIAAVRMRLAPGWKTYWRAPGDGGLPTSLKWSESQNLADLRILWPRPNVFDDGGMRSLGYLNEVVLPIELTPTYSGDISLKARLKFGVCREVCVPAVVDLHQILKQEETSDVTRIRSALVAAPIAAEQAGIHSVRCGIERAKKGHTLSVNVTADIPGTSRAMVIETKDAEVWVSRTKLKSEGLHWHGVTYLYDHRSTPATISPKDVRITLLTDQAAVDIQGCSTR
jgi:DsbC/DsbD-like thiol-disulfide interchange protein